MMRWSICTALAALCLTVGILVLLRPPAVAPFIVLSQPYRTPASLRDWIGGWIPTRPSWAWAWRLEKVVFGQRKPINLSFILVSMTSPSGSVASDLALGTATFSHPNGLRAWLLGPAEFRALQERFKQIPGVVVLSRPRINTADGIRSGLFTGQSVPLNGSTNQVGVSIDCLARVRPHATDLISCIQLSELVTNGAIARLGSAAGGVVSIQTNMDGAFRLQIPKGKGVFVLDGPSANESHPRFGVLLDEL